MHTTDPHRTVPATIQTGEWRYASKENVPGICEPKESQLKFACPGCGQLLIIPIGQAISDPRHWDIIEGSGLDPTSLSLMPSIANSCCGWHGYLKEGVFKSCD